MLAARHNASAVMTKNSNTGLVKLQNLASAVTRMKVQRFNMKTAVAQPFSSSMMHLIRVRMIMARYSRTLKYVNAVTLDVPLYSHRNSTRLNFFLMV